LKAATRSDLRLLAPWSPIGPVSDQFDQTGTVTVLLVSGTVVDAPLIRTTIEADPARREGMSRATCNEGHLRPFSVIAT
jgi:hypothetical protein